MQPSAIRTAWERRAFRELVALPREARQALLSAVDGLPSRPLAGALLDPRWKGLRRLRVGAHRVIYAFDGQLLLVACVGPAPPAR